MAEEAAAVAVEVAAAGAVLEAEWVPGVAAAAVAAAAVAAAAVAVAVGAAG